jgi:hypothetical protein
MRLTEQTYRKLVKGYKGRNFPQGLTKQLLPLWETDYRRAHGRAELVVVNLDADSSSFSYLFDIDRQRNIVAFGIPIYRQQHRDASRMAGHPLSAGSDYHRGHLMAHSIGGGADINLVPQLGRLNIGEFRVLERMVRALAWEGVDCLYFVRTIYEDGESQTPDWIEQCVIQSSGVVNYALHKNK